MLDIRWLEDLVAVAETRNITRAAELRNITQSGLSRRIQSLEHWVGAPLIDRRHAQIDLTEAGTKFLEAASETLARLNSARLTIRQDKTERLRQIRFAAPHILSVSFFPQWLPAMQTGLGGVRLSVASDNLPGCVGMLRDGTADFVVCLMDSEGEIASRADRSLAGEAWITVGRESLVPLSAPGPDGVTPVHALGTATSRAVSYLAYSPECSLGWAVEGLLGRRPALTHLQTLYDNSLADGLRTMALAGLGVAWLPLTMTEGDMMRGRLVRAGGADMTIDLDIRVYRSQQRLSKKAEDLWQTLRTAQRPRAQPAEAIAV